MEAATSTSRPQSATRRGLVVGEERERLAAGFGSRVRQERLALGLRQADLAELLGTQKSAVSRLERGCVRPSTTMVSRLARALRLGRGERAILRLEFELNQAAGPCLRGDGRRARRRRARLDAVLYSTVLAGTAGLGGVDDVDPFTSHLLRLIEVSSGD